MADASVTHSHVSGLFAYFLFPVVWITNAGQTLSSTLGGCLTHFTEGIKCGMTVLVPRALRGKVSIRKLPLPGYILRDYQAEN